jgi:CHAT domain-containing protein
LDSRTTLISFQLGDSVSWMWAVDRSALVLYALPPRRQIGERIKAAIGALREDRPDSVASGAALYQTLFGPLSPRFQRKSRWLLALDQGEHSALVYSPSDLPGLFDVPMAALAIETAGHHPVFVAERHSIAVIPGAGYWVAAITRQEARPPVPLFVGIGDAIYNTADPRLPGARTARQPSHGAFAASASTSLPSLALPRLVASGSELDACMSAWGGEGVLLKGVEASRDKLEAQIRRNPAVLHFATHFLSSNDGPASGLIALSLNRRGETELLAPVEIAHWKVRIGLVVLSGCHSVEGAVLPGSGLLGLTRAWLAAGAHSVIGSRWSTPDESGALFSALYGSLRGQTHPDAAEALRAAQVEMIRAGGWRARPRFWGAYLAVGDQ